MIPLSRVPAKLLDIAFPFLARQRERSFCTLLLASNLFDAEYYTTTYRDAADSGLDPVLHFLRHGGMRGYNPSADFDSAFYLQRHTDVRIAGVNPLLHYLLHGRYENREFRAPEKIAPRPRAPSDSDWEALAERVASLPTTIPAIDVVIPVYRGLDETANCIFTVVKSRIEDTTGFDIVVIDDSSPEPQVLALLRKLADRKLITLLRNEQNLGFVASVNRGMSEHAGRDVILLNSDTEVYGDWVTRLARAAHSQPNIGTVTPLSNNATICGYPRFAGEFDGQFEIGFEDIDRLASQSNTGLVVDVPTGVGFCLYIRRECIEHVGLFDVETFKLGYGEENDFCKRAEARGWRNVLTGDTFVRHLGRVSFGESSSPRVSKAVAIINERYPGYNAEIRSYVADDPPRPLRVNLDTARLRRAGRDRNVLFILHNLGGGTTRHVNELAALLAEENVGSYFLHPDTATGLAELSHPGVLPLSVPSQIDIRHGLAAAIDIVRTLRIAHIHVHHTLGFQPEIRRFIERVAKASGVSYDITIHDYFEVCPRLDMIDGSGVYCDNTDVSVCDACVKKNGAAIEMSDRDPSAWFWRDSNHRFAAGARRVFVPDDDVRQRLARFWPDIAVTVRPHPEETPERWSEPLRRQPDEHLRIAVIGAISERKGSSVLLKCAEDALNRKLPITFVIVGFSNRAEFELLRNVEVTGGYEEEELPDLLRTSRCHLAFFPSVWPETYSYTLSQALAAGLYPVSFDIGAIARRIRAFGWGRVLPFALVKDAAAVNDALRTTEATPRPQDWRPIGGRAMYPSVIDDYYEIVLPAAAAPIRGKA
jgi:GT2 family glycosyltransferase/glycosyltransferase involved in cell wall biosynthesis